MQHRARLPQAGPEDESRLAGSDAAEQITLLDSLFTACAADGACAQAYPRLRERFHALVAALKARPLTLPDGSQVTDESLYRSIFPFTAAIGYVGYYPRLIAELEVGSGATLAALQSGAIPESHHVAALGPVHPRRGELLDAYMNCVVDRSDPQAAGIYAQRLAEQWDAAPDQIAAFLMATCKDGSGAAASALVKELPAGVFNAVISSYLPQTVAGVNFVLNEPAAPKRPRLPPNWRR